MRKIIFILILLFSYNAYAEDFYFYNQAEAIDEAILFGNILNHEYNGCWGVFYASDNRANPNAGLSNRYFYPSPFTKYTDACVSEYEASGINTSFSGVNDSQLIFIYALLGTICGMCFVIPISLQVGR